MDDIILCRSVDENVPKSRWIASLSNGETIFEDSIKNIAPTWERLATYVAINKLAITNLRAQLNHLEVTLPPHQEAYIEKKKLVSTVGMAKRYLCIGYVQGGLCQIHQMSEDGDSISTIGPDPGPPFTIYPHNKDVCVRACCASRVSEGFTFENNGETYLVRRKDGSNIFACRIDNGKPRRGRPRRFDIREVLDSMPKG